MLELCACARSRWKAGSEQLWQTEGSLYCANFDDITRER